MNVYLSHKSETMLHINLFYQLQPLMCPNFEGGYSDTFSKKELWSVLDLLQNMPSKQEFEIHYEKWYFEIFGNN